MKDGKVSVIEVIPIVRGMTKDSLTYFTKEPLEPGNFVKVPVRKTTANAIVERVVDPKSAKAELKQASFVLKKLSDKKTGGTISPAFMCAAKKTALFYATSIGSVLGAVLPKLLLDEPDLFGKSSAGKSGLSAIIPPHEPLVIQSEKEERFATYAKFVREGFAKGKSTLLIAPTNEDAERLHSILSRGIQEYAYLFNSSKSRKELVKIWKGALASEHPVLMISTPAGIAFDREDLKTIIVERENSRAYRTLSRPYINLKFFFEAYARESRRQIIYGDSVLSVEALWKFKEGSYGEAEPVKWRLPYSARTHLLDMKGADKDKKFEFFSPELKSLFERAQSEGANVLLFGTRKGLYPTTVCGDCGTVLACKNCGSPMVLHEGSGERRFVCHACGNARAAETACGYCRSWNLVPLGIGIDKIVQEAKKHYTGDKIYVLDKDHAPTPASARRIAKGFQEAKGSLLVGTELAFLFLDKVPYAAAISLDPLFSIPDFGVNEKIFYIVSRLVETAEREAIIQTRNIGKQILAWAASGNVLEFYKDELSEREAILYPPLSLFIKVSLMDKEKDPQEKLETLKRDFSEWKPDFFRSSMVIRLPREKWPDQNLSQKLSLLTPEFLIKVDPESIL